MRTAAGAWLRRFTLHQVSTLLGALGIVFVAAVTSVMAVKDHATLHDEARDHAQSTATFLADQAQRLFEVADIVLHAAATSLGPLDWGATANNPDVVAALRRLDEMLPYVDSVFGADRAGTVEVSSIQPAPPRYSVADRSVFRQARDESADTLLIGEPVIGRVSGKPVFLLARRRSTPDGTFDGIVGVAMSLAFFTDYWRTVEVRNDERIALVRRDGAVLARFPALDPAEAGRLGEALAATATSGQDLPVAGTFSPGPHQYGSFRRLGSLPVYLAVVYGDATINARWLRALSTLALPTAASLLGIVALMLLARRLARREDAARRQTEQARAVLSADKTRLERHVAERTAELVETNKEIQRFAYIVSHDLRAPLVNIMGFSTELKACFAEVMTAAGRGEANDTGERLRAEVEEAFGFIAASTEKMDRLIKAILALSRQGQRVFKPERLDMDALMRATAAGLAHRVQSIGATVTVAPLPGIVADRIAVEQVFANLLDNAVKYLRPDVPGQIRITGAPEGATAVFTVTDNGRGIAPSDRERVFELFRRAGRQDMPGEGIGLAHVRSLVRRLQGTIVLDGAEGQGSVFTVTLPLVWTEEP